MFKGKKKAVYCDTIEEFNRQMQIAGDICSIIFYEKYDSTKPISTYGYLEETDKFYKLTYKLCKEKKTYIFDKNGEKHYEFNVAQVSSEMSRQAKIQKVSELLPNIEFDKTPFKDGCIGYRMSIGSASPIRDANTKYINKETTAWEYDLSSAYGQFLKEQLPDLNTVQYNTEVKEGQVGFTTYGSTRHGFPRLHMVTKVGVECEWVFDLMPSPYVDWVNRIFEQLDIETDEKKREELKFKFRGNVGQLQNTNPFWRCMIVEKCNRLIKSLLDDNSIYWSTDSIVSAVKRDDILKTPYKWKIKHNELPFRLKTKTYYQWGNEIPMINGKQKLVIEYYNMIHTAKFNILVDNIPNEVGSKYVINKETFRVELNKELI